MKSILVATDLSPSSDLALARAVLLAAETRSRLQVIHVLASGERDGAADHKSVGETAADIHNRIEQAFWSLKSSADWDRPPVIAVKSGDPFAEIMTHAEQVGADLIVMGKHQKGSEELKERFFGTTIERVVRKGTRPVLMAVTKPVDPFKRVLVGTDFSEGAAVVCQLAQQVAPEGEFWVTHTYEMPYGSLIRDPYAKQEIEQEHRAALKGFVEQCMADTPTGAGVRVNLDLREDLATSGLRAAVSQFKPDLLALGAHGRSGLKLAIVGSTAHDFLVDPPADILIGKGAIS